MIEIEKRLDALEEKVREPHERLDALETEIKELKDNVIKHFVGVYEQIHKGFSLVKGELERLEKKLSQ